VLKATDERYIYLHGPRKVGAGVGGCDWRGDCPCKPPLFQKPDRNYSPEYLILPGKWYLPSVYVIKGGWRTISVTGLTCHAGASLSLLRNPVPFVRRSLNLVGVGKAARQAFAIQTGISRLAKESWSGQQIEGRNVQSDVRHDRSVAWNLLARHAVVSRRGSTAQGATRKLSLQTVIRFS